MAINKKGSQRSGTSKASSKKNSKKKVVTQSAVDNKTPIRSALKKESLLLPHVKDGMGDIENAHRDYFEAAIRSQFSDSLDLDKATKRGHEGENRWDYLLGHASSKRVIAVEPHSAKQDEVTTVINKRKMSRDRLKEHLRDGAKVDKWLWVASNKIHFANTEKTVLQLSQNGIEFVGRKVAAKHLI